LPGSSDACLGNVELADAARRLFEELKARSLMLACAESCTGGLVTAAITDIPGSSEVLWGGVAAYTNECKERLLGVPREAIESYGAVSTEVAIAMAEGALKACGPGAAIDLSLAISGIAGPGGGSEAKPVGLVCFAWRARSGEGREESLLFPGGRKAVREAAALHAMNVAASLAGSLSRR
jgi:nicotinamide-nucleotide amidase